MRCGVDGCRPRGSASGGMPRLGRCGSRRHRLGVTIVRRYLDTLEQQFGRRFSHAATSFPPGTDPRISINVLESAGLEVSHVLDEPTAVADLLQLDNAGVVDIGGGTTGIAIVKKGKVTYSADEATGGHHISLTLAGNRRIPLEEAEQYKCGHGDEIWPAVKPVYEKMADIVARHIEGQGITDLWLAGGSCMQPGVETIPGVTGAFTAAQFVYDPAGNRQSWARESGGAICKMNCRPRSFRRSIP